MTQIDALPVPANVEELLPWSDPEFVRAPWPWFDRVLREHPMLQLEDGTVVFTRYADVVKWAKHPSLVSVPPDGIGDSPWAANLNSVLLTEGERHSRIRRTFSSWLTPKACREWAAIAAKSASDALDRMSDDQVIEAHRELGVQPAQDAMAHVLGIPPGEGFPLIHATNQTMMAMGIAPTEDQVQLAHEGFGFMMFEADRLIAAKRRTPGDGLLDEMIKAADAGGLSERELKESIQILWGSAAHNPGQVMASALVDLAENPDVFTAYKNEEESREAILNEVIRRSLPEMALDRWNTAPLVIHDVELPVGTPLRFILGAALRDPEVFPNADEFDYKRPKEASMAIAFGVGTHNCAGQAFGRAVARAVLDVAIDRYESVSIVVEPEWFLSDRHRNCEGLTVKFA